ncbi:MAG: DUF5804 family protein [Methanoculleaceae archaeon]
MDVLFIGKENIDLYTTLLRSETSRHILRFYDPENLPGGVRVRTGTLGNALSIASELRWYSRRYMDGVLFGLEPGIWATWSFATRLYERSLPLSRSWPHRRRVLIRRELLDRIPAAEVQPSEEEGEAYLIVWCTEEEVEAA